MFDKCIDTLLSIYSFFLPGMTAIHKPASVTRYSLSYVVGNAHYENVCMHNMITSKNSHGT